MKSSSSKKTPPNNLKLANEKCYKAEAIRGGFRQVTSPGATKSFACRVCLKITLGSCIGGSAIGFCLLLAGGIAKHPEIKSLMYIGIMVFLVSVILLVILCSSAATGIAHTPLPPAARPNMCLYQDYFDKSLESKIPCGKNILPQGLSLYAIPQGKSSSFPLEYYIEIPRPTQPGIDFAKGLQQQSIDDHGHPQLKSLKRKEQEPCAVKNCVCQVKGSPVNQEAPYNDLHPSPNVLGYELPPMNPHSLVLQQPRQTEEDKRLQLNLKQNYDQWYPHT